jgi:3alpha(or 20beta)-hydroxysteroid dehydrogenase
VGRLDDRTAIITGASRGQGAAEARRFVEEGSHVVLADVRDDEGARLAHELGPRARFVHLDVSDSTAWPAAVEQPRAWPPVRVLVNNAGMHRLCAIEEENGDDVMRLWAVNQLGPLLGIKSVTAAMRAAGGGSIVNVSSAAGLVGLPSQAAYSASKWALRGITRSAALELGTDDIRVNCIHPGPIDTDMMRPPGSDPARTTDFSALPLRRCGQVDEVAELVLFLASDDSSYLTGAEIAIDGGFTAGPRPAARPAPRPSGEAARG